MQAMKWAGNAFPPSSCRTTIGQLMDWDPWKAPTLRRKQQFGQHSGLKGTGLIPGRGQEQGSRSPCDCPRPKPGLDPCPTTPGTGRQGWDSGPWHCGTSRR